MLQYIHKVLVVAAGLLSLGGVSAATENTTLSDDEMVYTYGEANMVYGTGEEGVYEVALHITEPELLGAQVTGLRIPMRGAGGVSKLHAWLTNQLTLGMVDGRRVTVPDIASVDLDAKAGTIEVRFDQPYEIPETGLYAGYSFFVDNASETLFTTEPIMVTNVVGEEGFYIHTSRTFRFWTNFAQVYQYQGSLAMQVILSGDVLHGDAARVVATRDVYTVCDEPPVAELTIANRGTHGLHTVQIDYDIDGQEGSALIDLPSTGGEAIYNQKTEVQLPLPAQSQTGAYSLHFRLASVNGQPNSETEQTTGDVALNVFTELPRHQPVLEEYTGLWCAYCPRGAVGLSEMARLHPDDFIGVSYHHSSGIIDYEPMQFSRESSCPVNNYPTAWLDRMMETDPFCGIDVYRSFGIERLWQMRCKDFSPAWIDVSADLSEDRSAVDLTATVRFVADQEQGHPYQLAYLLVADSLYSDSWIQSNAYTGEQGWPSSMDEYTGGPHQMTVVHRDVVVARSGIGGIEGSLPEHITAFQPLTHSWHFQLADVVNSWGEPLIQDASAPLHVVALLIDSTTGTIVNARQAWLGQSSAIRSTAASATAANAVYNLNGQRLKGPARGLNITGDRKVLFRSRP